MHCTHTHRMYTSHKFYENCYFFFLWSEWTNSAKTLHMEFFSAFFSVFQIHSMHSFKNLKRLGFFHTAISSSRSHLTAICLRCAFVFMNIVVGIIKTTLFEQFSLSHWSIMSIFFDWNTRCWLAGSVLPWLLLSRFYVMLCALFNTGTKVTHFIRYCWCCFCHYECRCDTSYWNHTSIRQNIIILLERTWKRLVWRISNTAHRWKCKCSQPTHCIWWGARKICSLLPIDSIYIECDT